MPTPANIRRYYPFFAASVVAVIATVAVFMCRIGPLPKALPAGTLTFGIVVAGFAAAHRNMLLGMRGSDVLRILASSGYSDDVLDYLRHSVNAGLVVSVVSGIGFFLGDSALLWKLWSVAMIFLVALVILLLHRNESLMSLVVKRFINQETDQR